MARRGRFNWDSKMATYLLSRTSTAARIVCLRGLLSAKEEAPRVAWLCYHSFFRSITVQRDSRRWCTSWLMEKSPFFSPRYLKVLRPTSIIILSQISLPVASERSPPRCRSPRRRMKWNMQRREHEKSLFTPFVGMFLRVSASYFRNGFVKLDVFIIRRWMFNADVFITRTRATKRWSWAEIRFTTSAAFCTFYVTPAPNPVFSSEWIQR